MPDSQIHARVWRAEWAIARYGALARRLFAALDDCDPPADAAVAYLAATADFDLDEAWRAWQRGDEPASPITSLFESVTPLPAWVDWAAIDRARRPFERTGLFGGLVLSLRSLMGGYLAPAGNKPLVFSGRLRSRAGRRMAETTRFVTAVCAPGGMRPGAEGWLICLRVRLMHAQVRRLLWASGRWDRASWAEPINQHDMVATMLLFSEVYIEGLRAFGFHIDAQEAEDWLQLWRLVAWVLGTREELLPRNYAEATALRELIEHTQGPPDDDSRALAAALLDAVPRGRTYAARRSMVRGMSRMLIGDANADSLEIPPTLLWPKLLSLMSATIAAGEQLRLRVPAIEIPLRRAGVNYWAWVVDMALGGHVVGFGRPDSLGGV